MDDGSSVGSWEDVEVVSEGSGTGTGTGTCAQQEMDGILQREPRIGEELEESDSEEQQSVQEEEQQPMHSSLAEEQQSIQEEEEDELEDVEQQSIQEEEDELEDVEQQSIQEEEEEEELEELEQQSVQGEEPCATQEEPMMAKIVNDTVLDQLLEQINEMENKIELMRVENKRFSLKIGGNNVKVGAFVTGRQDCGSRLAQGGALHVLEADERPSLFKFVAKSEKTLALRNEETQKYLKLLWSLDDHFLTQWHWDFREATGFTLRRTKEDRYMLYLEKTPICFQRSGRILSLCPGKGQDAEDATTEIELIQAPPKGRSPTSPRGRFNPFLLFVGIMLCYGLAVHNDCFMEPALRELQPGNFEHPTVVMDNKDRYGEFVTISRETGPGHHFILNACGGTMRFGTGNRWVYRHVPCQSGKTVFECSTGFFNADPKIGEPKVCQYASSRISQDGVEDPFDLLSCLDKKCRVAAHGPGTIRFGSNGRWVFKEIEYFTEFECGPAFFGAKPNMDPNARDRCYFKPLEKFDAQGFRPICKEYGDCVVDQPGTVRYGQHGKWTFKELDQAQKFRCGNTFFGRDPIHHVIKTCYFRPKQQETEQEGERINESSSSPFESFQEFLGDDLMDKLAKGGKFFEGQLGKLVKKTGEKFRLSKKQRGQLKDAVREFTTKQATFSSSSCPVNSSSNNNNNKWILLDEPLTFSKFSSKKMTRIKLPSPKIPEDANEIFVNAACLLGFENEHRHGKLSVWTQDSDSNKSGFNVHLTVSPHDGFNNVQQSAWIPVPSNRYLFVKFDNIDLAGASECTVSVESFK